MSTPSNDSAALRELLELLSHRELAAATVERVVARALLALDDPEDYLIRFPDEEGLVEGLDLLASNEASLRLLHFIFQEELRRWWLANDRPNAIAERVVDRLALAGIAIPDPPASALTLNSVCAFLTAQLAKLPEPHALIEFQSGVNNMPAFNVCTHSDAKRVVELARQLGLRVVIREK